jgi:hypothetical protein
MQHEIRIELTSVEMIAEEPIATAIGAVVNAGALAR